MSDLHLIKKIEEVLKYINTLKDNMIYQYYCELHVLSLKLQQIKNFENNLNEEIVYLRENIGSCRLLEEKIKSLDIIKEWEQNNSNNVSYVQSHIDKIIEIAKFEQHYQEKLDMVELLKTSELEKLLYYLNKKKSKLRSRKQLGFECDYDRIDIFDRRFFKITNCEERINLDISGLSKRVNDEQYFLKILNALNEFINIAKMNNFHELTFSMENWDFSSYSKETKMLFNSIMFSINTIEKLDLQALFLCDDDIMYFFKDCKFVNSLKSINLSNNKLTNLDFLKECFNNLETLIIDGNEIDNIDAIEFVPNLKEVDLSFNNITDVKALTNVVNLTDINLSHNEICDISSLSSHSKLKKLDVHFNHINID